MTHRNPERYRIPFASVLAIGTELTAGQITNRNAAWLSSRLVDLGVQVVLHETVADDHKAIQSALDRCRAVSQLIFVTGGLGPTTDDFTRECIAQWLGKPLQYNESTWNKITERLSRLGIPVAESNRQQCFFPEGAQIIPNEQGTADAFSAQVGENTEIWVLPGPPREVEAVWKSGIEAAVRATVPATEPLQLLTWQCIGKSEAELGEITENVLSGSGLAIGYRAHRPYVEIKVWCTAEDIRTKQNHLRALDQALTPWIATRQGEDLAARLISHFKRASEVEVIDSASGGILGDRLGQLLREPEYSAVADSVTLATEWTSPHSPLEWTQNVLSEADTEVLTLVIAGFSESGEWAMGIREGDWVKVETGTSPYKSLELLDRSRRYAVEFALKRWSEWLRKSTN